MLKYTTKAATDIELALLRAKDFKNHCYSRH